MTRFSIKGYLPRSLFGRAALILLVPIITIQIVVSFAFIQRLYEDVTEQMTQNMAAEVILLLDVVENAQSDAQAMRDLASIAQSLRMNAVLPGQFAEDRKLFYDFSGRIISETFHKELDQLLGVDLRENDKFVRMAFETSRGVLEISFPRRRVSASNPHQLLVLMLLTGILMTLIAFVFLRNQLRPIRRLANAAEAFGKGMVEPYQPTGAIEIRSAGNAFLNMRARIERQIEQRTLMLSGVSHDLRTPLTRLKLGLTMQPDTPEVKALVADVDEMERLIEAFLNFARADAVEELARKDIIKLLENIVENAHRTGADVTFGAMPEKRAKLKIRPLAIRRAIENLINNAVRYGTRVRVSVRLLDKALRISIEDNGPGIPAAQRDQALKPFSRLDASRNQNKGSGVGLGLAIAADIVRSHGGSLRLGKSTDLKGLNVEIILPL